MERPVRAKRTLRVIKWLSTTPAIGICTACMREFKVPMSSLTRTSDAQANLQGQFDSQVCTVVARQQSESEE